METVPSESVQLVSVPQRASLARERVRLSTHLTWLFDVKTRLSHRGNKLRLVFVDLHISEYVVYETGESRGCLGTDDADASDKGAVHGTLDEAEDMLHAASGLGLLAVILLLPVCQRMVTMPFLADDGYHATLPDHIVLGFIAGIKIQRLSVVLFLNERIYDSGVGTLASVVTYSSMSLVFLSALAWSL